MRRLGDDVPDGLRTAERRDRPPKLSYLADLDNEPMPPLGEPTDDAGDANR